MEKDLSRRNRLGSGGKRWTIRALSGERGERGFRCEELEAHGAQRGNFLFPRRDGLKVLLLVTEEAKYFFLEVDAGEGGGWPGLRDVLLFFSFPSLATLCSEFQRIEERRKKAKGRSAGVCCVAVVETNGFGAAGCARKERTFFFQFEGY